MNYRAILLTGAVTLGVIQQGFPGPDRTCGGELPIQAREQTTLVAGTAEQAAAPAAGYDAKFVTMAVDVPRRLLTGQVFKAAFVFRNTGAQGWGPANERHVVLRSQEPADNMTWGTFFIIQGQGTNVPVGEEFTFASYLQAPSKPGRYVFQWRLGRMNRGEFNGPVTLFGEASQRLTLDVQPRPEEAPPRPQPQDPSEKQVLAYEDFEYAGSFRIPDRPGQDLPFSHSGLALRKMKDGAKRLFFNYTLPGTMLVEVEIPPLVKLDERRDYAALKVAKVKKEWGRLELKAPKTPPGSIFANGGFWWDEGRKTLFWTWWHPYWCGNPPPVLGASRLADDGTVTNSGPWSVPDHCKSYWGGVIGLPKPFADQYAGGKTLALGFGTCYSGDYADSLGPSLAAIADPVPGKNTVDLTVLLGHYKGDCAPRDGNYFIVGGNGWMGRQPDSPSKGYCGSSDLVRSAIFIDTPKKHAFVAFYYLATGRIGYDYGSGTPGGRAHAWYFYDPKDLGAVAQGLKKAGQIVPRSRTNVVLPGEVGDFITGSCWDEEEKLLYLYNPLSKGSVHAYRVK